MKKQIMIVEDQLSTRMLLRHYLGNFFHVVEKENPMEALAWLHHDNMPSVIISDINMPEMNGIDFLHELNTKFQTMPPVIMLTSIESTKEKVKCFQLGARDYVTKPFNPEELRMRIANLMLV